MYAPRVMKAIPIRPSRIVLSVALLMLSACGGGSPEAATPSAAAPEDVPQHMLTAPADVYGSVVMHDGASYLFVSFSRGLEGMSELGLTVTECQGAEDTPCDTVLDANDAVREAVGEGPPSVTLLGASGPCEAQVGALAVLNTSNCEESVTLARRLSGCEGLVAPVARVSGRFDADLRYQPAPEVSTTPVSNVADTGTLSDDAHRARVAAWIAEPAYGGDIVSGEAALVSVDVGTESLVTSAAGFLRGPAADECEQSPAHHITTGVQRGEAFTTVRGLEQWDGVISWRGRIVGVTTGSPYFTELYTITAERGLRREFQQQVWADNEECTAGSGWAEPEYPCGP